VAVGAALLALAGCSSGEQEPSATDSHGETAAAAAAPAASASATPPVVDVTQLAAGRPPRAAYVAGGVLHWHGRTTNTDFPASGIDPQILGPVDGRPVVVAFQADGADSGDRFWVIDDAGHARRVGRSYEVYDYSPRLVAATGHIWIQNEDRSTPRTIWELDARTGRQIAAWGHNSVPRGLAPDDQALVDAWVHRRQVVPDTEAGSADGSLLAKTISVQLGESFGEAVVVRRTSDRSEVARFVFPTGVYSHVSRVVFEGRGHVMVLTSVSYTRRRGAQQAIVRCSIRTASCERATEIGGNMALGVVRPLFEPARPHG
jgi:hypothetical protein